VGKETNNPRHLTLSHQRAIDLEVFFVQISLYKSPIISILPTMG
jgi:hypothetical protein